MEKRIVYFIAFVLMIAGCNVANEPDDATSSDSDSDVKRSTENIETDSSDPGMVQTTLPGNGGTMKWVVIEPGSFTMGTHKDEYGRSPYELQHEVTLIHRYAILSTEVTRKQWKAIPSGGEPLFEYSDCADGSETCSETCLEDDCPITPMGVNAAKTWLDALSEAEGLTPCYKTENQWATPIHCPGYRLPTESEWERAARAGDNRATYIGDFSRDSYDNDDKGEEVLAPIAWCDDDKAHPVAQRAPNILGIYDIIGNVSELALWEGTYTVPAPLSPHGDLQSGYISKRGGNFKSKVNGFRECRAGNRRRAPALPESKHGAVGLRPVRTLAGSTLPEPHPLNWCPLAPQIPTECIESVKDTPILLHTISVDATYTDMVKSNYDLAVIGNRQVAGPFVEIVRMKMGQELESTPVYAAEAQKSFIGTKITNAVDAKTQLWATLCNPENSTCALYEVDESGTSDLTPVDNGAIPSWLGDSPALLFFTNPFKVYAAGNGIAVFDGTAWKEEVPQTEGIRFTSIDGIETPDDTVVVAVGSEGKMILKDASGWQSLKSNTSETLLSVHLAYNNITDLLVNATGTGGTVLTGPIDGLSNCFMNSEDWLDVVLSPSITELPYTLISSDGTVVDLHNDYSGPGAVRSCYRSAVPDKWIKTIIITGGIAINYFHLTEDGIYGNEMKFYVD